MNAFEKIGKIYLAGSKKSLKIIINATTGEEIYYVSVKDVQKALAQPSFCATILKIADNLDARIHAKV